MTSLDVIPLKVIKTTENIIESHLATIINKDLAEYKFSEDVKTALARPIYEKGDRDKPKNYRPASLLHGFSKTVERFYMKS